MTKEQIADRFTYKSPSEAGSKRHAELSAGFIALATLCQDVMSDGRELALVLTNLEQAKFWASAGVARNPETR